VLHPTPAGKRFSSHFLRPLGEGIVLHEKWRDTGSSGLLAGLKVSGIIES